MFKKRSPVNTIYQTWNTEIIYMKPRKKYQNLKDGKNIIFQAVLIFLVLFYSI